MTVATGHRTRRYRFEKRTHRNQDLAALLAEGPAQTATLKDIETADAAIVLGEDLTAAAPRAALSQRQTARAASLALAAEKGVPGWLDNAARVAGEGRRAPIALATPLPDALDDTATFPIRRAPRDIAAFGQAVAAAIRGETAGDSDAEAVATGRGCARGTRCRHPHASGPGGAGAVADVGAHGR